jgi:hypothetical protein
MTADEKYTPGLTEDDERGRSHYKEGSKLTDSIIRVRELLLNRLAGVDESDVMNVTPNNSIPVKGPELASELKRYLDEIRVSAIDEGGGKVDYSRIRDGRAYQEYRSQCSPLLRIFDPAILRTIDEQLAFWINLYNALIIDAVIAFDKKQSVTDGKFGVLTFFRRAAYNVCGLRVSCEDIEHGILRSNRGHPYLPGRHFISSDQRLDWVINVPDVRIHFALNCASKSCPPIQFYSADHLDSQLDQAAANFVNNNVKVDRQNNVLTTSEIFRWYEVDFGAHRGVIEFLYRYLPDDNRKAWLADNQQSTRIKYEKYDWGLNT